jgi:hypothetical protein
MQTFQNTVTIARPVGEVFAFLAVPRVKAGVARNLGTLKELLESTRPAAQVGPRRS